jgi:hypothetical protein
VGCWGGMGSEGVEGGGGGHGQPQLRQCEGGGDGRSFAVGGIETTPKLIFDVCSSFSRETISKLMSVSVVEARVSSDGSSDSFRGLPISGTPLSHCRVQSILWRTCCILEVCFTVFRICSYWVAQRRGQGRTAFVNRKQTKPAARQKEDLRTDLRYSSQRYIPRLFREPLRCRDSSYAGPVTQ